MSTTNRARTITRWCAVGVMAAAVVTATADGFAQSYAGLYAWALDHGLHGWKAASFPLMVDLLIAVGELGLFLLAIDAYSLQRKHFLTWFDFLLPLLIAVAGWTASLIFNVGHVQEHDFSFQATAAVPPIVSMLGLLVLLRTLHRYVSERPPGTKPEHAPGTSAQATRFIYGPVPAAAGGGPGAAVPGYPPRDDSAPGTEDFRLVRLARWPGPNGGGGADKAGRQRADGEAAEPEAATVRDSTASTDSTADGGGDRRAGDRAGDVAKPEEPPARPDPQPAAEPAEPDSVPIAAGARADDPVVPAPTPVDAEVVGNGRGNGSTLTLREATRERLLDELHEHQGDVQAALEAIEADGLSYDAAEARKIRRNNWLPYVVFRLLAQHGGDVDRVSQALLDKGIECDRAVLEELARSWQ